MAANVEAVGRLFPNALTEVMRDGKAVPAIDFDVLRQELSREIVEGREERYAFTWPDKRQAIYDERVLRTMFHDANATKTPENPLNDRFYRKEFQALWKRINHKYAYTVSFDSRELVRAAIDHINAELRVSRLQYTITYGGQQTDLDAAMVADGTSFSYGRSRTRTLKRAQGSTVTYDLIGRIAAGTTLTRRTTAEILRGIKAEVFAGYRYNPEEFIRTVTRLILEQKATRIVDHIAYHTTAGSYDASIFATEKRPSIEAYEAEKAVQDYVFTDGNVERQFVKELDGGDEVLIYAKLPRGFAIPTPVGNYAPDWAIVFRGCGTSISSRRRRGRSPRSSSAPSRRQRSPAQRSCSRRCTATA